MPSKKQTPPSHPTKSNKPANVTTTLLSRAHSPSTTQRLLTDKLHPERPLHLRPTDALSSSSPLTNARHARRTAREVAQRRRKKSKPKPLSAREKRAMCIYELSAAEKKYIVFQPLHALWVGYMQELLQLVQSPLPPMTAAAALMPAPPRSSSKAIKAAVGHRISTNSSKRSNSLGALDNAIISRLASADFHGAKLRVVRSRCVSRVGIEGIVVRDSKFAFQVVTRVDAVRVLPKEHSVFRFEVPWPMRAVGVGVRDGGGDNGQDSLVDKVESGEKAERTEDQGEQLGRRNLVFELHGDQFQYRAVDRANKKFKTHFLPNL